MAKKKKEFSYECVRCGDTVVLIEEPTGELAEISLCLECVETALIMIDELRAIREIQIDAQKAKEYLG